MENRRKFVVLTSGGDSPAMNAVVFSFAAAAQLNGDDVYASIDGYRGLVEGNFEKVCLRQFRDKVCTAGTAIGTSRCLEFKDEAVRKKAIEGLRSRDFEALFVIGGDGSYQGANLISQLGFPVITAPGTIDNDVASSKFTIGFFSAMEEIFQAIRRIRCMSESHSQITFLEVMGRHCCDLALYASMAGMADLVITGQNPRSPDELLQVLREMISTQKRGIVVVVAEKIYGPSGGFGLPTLNELCSTLEASLGRQVRYSVLGYVQRGADPTSWDLFMAHKFGMKAYDLLRSGQTNVAIGFDGGDFYTTNLSEAVKMANAVDSEIENFVNNLYKIS